jgi:hypothetical protein
LVDRNASAEISGVGSVAVIIEIVCLKAQRIWSAKIKDSSRSDFDAANHGGIRWDCVGCTGFFPKCGLNFRKKRSR